MDEMVIKNISSKIEEYYTPRKEEITKEWIVNENRLLLLIALDVYNHETPYSKQLKDTLNVNVPNETIKKMLEEVPFTHDDEPDYKKFRDNVQIAVNLLLDYVDGKSSYETFKREFNRVTYRRTYDKYYFKMFIMLLVKNFPKTYQDELFKHMCFLNKNNFEDCIYNILDYLKDNDFSHINKSSEVLNMNTNSLISKIPTEYLDDITNILNDAYKSTDQKYFIENCVIYCLCINFSMSIEDMKKCIKDKFNIVATFADVKGFLDKIRLVKRMEFFSKVKSAVNEIILNLADFENNSSVNFVRTIKNFSGLEYTQNSEFSMRKYFPKFVLYTLVQNLEDVLPPETATTCMDIPNVHCKKCLFTIRDNILKSSKKSDNVDKQQLIDDMEERVRDTENMLRELQEEFEQRLASEKREELTKFFSNLNSAKYSYIIDEVFLIRKNYNELKKNGYRLPNEIIGLENIITKLMYFIKDSNIKPMVKPDTELEITSEEIENYYYVGTPFNGDEVKKVKVVSPGWKFVDTDICISKVKVVEI